MGTLAYVGLGSNLGPREDRIEAALGLLSRAGGVRIRRRSPLYETDPVGGPPQGKYLNGVVEVEADLPAPDLLARLFRVEEGMGRRREVRFGPREIDLDLLLFGNEVRNDPDLILPHPRMRDREFVLRPLADLEPDLRVPPDGARVRDLLLRIRKEVR